MNRILVLRKFLMSPTPNETKMIGNSGAIEKAIQRHHINQPTAVSDHFSLPGHSINNIELIPLELIKSNRDGIRKAREALLISKGKTLEPHRINRRDET